MVINGNKLKELIQNEKLIENIDLKAVNSCSADLSISNKALKFKKIKGKVSLDDIERIENLYEDIEITKGYVLKPGESILVGLNEKINMPDNMCGHVRPRTSLSRLGIMINHQHINAGYQGTLSLLVTNVSINHYEIIPNLRIGQLVVESLDDSAGDLVYSKEETPMYQEETGPQGSKIYSDYIGKVVRHFKGNYYYIENMSMDSETKEMMVVYRPLYHREDSMVWNRPLKMFFEEVDIKRPDNITKQKHRFEFMKEFEHDYTKDESKS